MPSWCHLAVLTTAQTVLSSGFLFKSDSWLLGERGGVGEGEELLIASLSAMLALSSFDVTDSWSLSSQSKGELSDYSNTAPNMVKIAYFVM